MGKNKKHVCVTAVVFSDTLQATGNNKEVGIDFVIDIAYSGDFNMRNVRDDAMRAIEQKTGASSKYADCPYRCTAAREIYSKSMPAAGNRVIGFLDCRMFDSIPAGVSLLNGEDDAT